MASVLWRECDVYVHPTSYVRDNIRGELLLVRKVGERALVAFRVQESGIDDQYVIVEAPGSAPGASCASVALTRSQSASKARHVRLKGVLPTSGLCGSRRRL